MEVESQGDGFLRVVALVGRAALMKAQPGEIGLRAVYASRSY